MIALAAGLAAAVAVASTSVPADDVAAARTAWRYFERNYHPETGLVSSVDGHPSTTAWDLGSTILGTVAARELGLLGERAFDARIAAVLRTLASQPLFAGALPNKAYDARTGAMTDYANRPAPRGIGWSALDLGRLASALGVLAGLAPEHRPAIARVLGRWRWCDLVSGGELRGAQVEPSGEVAIVQEGRLGYEQYAARAIERLGPEAALARRWDRHAQDEEILGVRVLRDTRDPARFGAIDALATEPFVLYALEHGADAQTARLLRGMLEVQKRRWERTGVVTAATEDHVDRPPWFVYGAVWAAGRPWRTVTPDGADAAALSGLSTKAAFALAALHPEDPYARVLLGAIARASDPERGFYAGVYDDGRLNRALTANTNGVVLEALLWKARGPLHAAAGETGLARWGGACPAAIPAPGPATSPAAAATSLAPASLASLGAPTGSALAPPPPSRREERRLRLGGSVFTGYRGADRATAGAVATLSPWRASFLRLGGEVTPFSPDGNARLLWGIGWEDWRDRTFFLHADDWGPIRPEALGRSQAEVNAGYKLPRVCPSRALCLAPVTGVVVPFVGGPYLQARVSLEVGRTWFLMGGLGWTVPGVHEGPAGTPSWRVVYGFGRSDWRPGGLFVTYHDWGPDSRRGNGIVAVGVNWAY